MHKSHTLRTLTALTLTVFALLLAGSTLAGDRHERCNLDTQECLDKMAAKMRAKGWLGIETAKLDDGWYKISAVKASSPAAEAGLQPGDVLLALNGVKLNAKNKAELKKVKKTLGPGKTANNVVKRQGAKVQVAVTLSQVPEIQIAEWIGQHLLENHAGEQIAAAN